MGVEVLVNISTIANAGSLAPAIDLGGTTLAGIIIPSAWTAANLTFSVSTDNVTFNDLYDSTGTEVSVTVAASRFIRLSPADWVGVRFLKVRSGTAAVPVAQGATRAISLVTKVV